MQGGSGFDFGRPPCCPGRFLAFLFLFQELGHFCSTRFGKWRGLVERFTA
jgi:hypothetical protein